MAPHCPLRWWPLLLALFAVTAAAQAADAPAVSDRVHISADHLLVDNKAQSATFSGSVTAVQGATRISADRITVFYEGADAGADGDTAGAVRRMVSEGNVIIHFDDKVAVTRKAVYSKETGLLELIGANTRVTSGQNTITGSRIIVDRTKDNVTVEGGDGKRVEAVIFPDQNGGGGLLPPAPPPAVSGQAAP